MLFFIRLSRRKDLSFSFFFYFLFWRPKKKQSKAAQNQIDLYKVLDSVAIVHVQLLAFPVGTNNSSAALEAAYQRWNSIRTISSCILIYIYFSLLILDQPTSGTSKSPTITTTTTATVTEDDDDDDDDYMLKAAHSLK